MDFSVPNIQLEYSPGTIKLGRRRGSTYKNQSTFSISEVKNNNSVLDKYPIRAGENPYQYKSPQPLGSPQHEQLRWYQQEIESRNNQIRVLKKVNDDLLEKVNVSTGTIKKFIPTDRNHNPFFDKYRNSPVLQQPFYSKRKPKVGLTDPLLTHFSPRMSTFGERVLSPHKLSF